MLPYALTKDTKKAQALKGKNSPHLGCLQSQASQHSLAQHARRGGLHTRSHSTSVRSSRNHGQELISQEAPAPPAGHAARAPCSTASTGQRTGLSLSHDTRCLLLAQLWSPALLSQGRQRSPGCSSPSLAHGGSQGPHSSWELPLSPHWQQDGLLQPAFPPCGAAGASRLPQPAGVMSFTGTAGLPASTHSALNLEMSPSAPTMMTLP